LLIPTSSSVILFIDLYFKLDPKGLLVKNIVNLSPLKLGKWEAEGS